jgi:hypothetical protein
MGYHKPYQLALKKALTPRDSPRIFSSNGCVSTRGRRWPDTSGKFQCFRDDWTQEWDDLCLFFFDAQHEWFAIINHGAAEFNADIFRREGNVVEEWHTSIVINWTNSPNHKGGNARLDGNSAIDSLGTDKGVKVGWD